ncbi:hypothetical protein E8E13_003944 [Curvularia kusanoi]|uniref:Uncharacterized protein n=1 Tax=Curvularia kusanoi TaxID=90978 RepID=A0A9P4W806_CURKU|nr:hypothetical protein E8E13_003944 [Curvularia kusanoi]
MPCVSEIIYSRDATVQAFRDYFKFLMAMYLDESVVVEPPEDGWDTINPIGWANFDKTDKVIDLLRHLPYINMDINIAPDCEFVDWHTIPVEMDGTDIKEATEPDPEDATIPFHIVGLTLQNTRGLTFLLDTELGVIYWRECMSEAKNEILEVEWRAGSGIWEITGFFEMLKANFKSLNFVPFRPDKFKAAWYGRSAEAQETLEGVQKIYKDHGWPDLMRYRKDDCLAAIEAYLKTRD